MSDKIDTILLSYSKMENELHPSQNIIQNESGTNIAIWNAKGQEGNFENWLPLLANATISDSGLSTNINILSKSQRLYLPVPAGTSLSEAYTVIVLTTGQDETTEMAPGVRNAMVKMLSLTTRLYKDALLKCKEIINGADLEDDESRQETAAELASTMSQYNSVLSHLYNDLIEWQGAEPVAVSFLLIEVLPNIKNLEAETQITIIKHVLEKTRPSVRFSAIKALDQMGISIAQKLLSTTLANEPSKTARQFIVDSLAAG